MAKAASKKTTGTRRRRERKNIEREQPISNPPLTTLSLPSLILRATQFHGQARARWASEAPRNQLPLQLRPQLRRLPRSLLITA